MLRMLPIVLFTLALSVPALAHHSHEGELVDHEKIAAKGKKKKKKKGKNAEPTPAPAPPDADNDGIEDSLDKCPEEAEDQDLHEDEDGCPDPDNDGDGINDADDDCPFEAENVDGWDDTDGCPEAEPAIAPMTLDATLMDGTKIKATVIRIIATDEDEKKSTPFEPTDFEVIINDTDEIPTPWSNLRSMKAEKVNFTDAVDCYSEGVQDLGDEAPMWECTLKHPTVVTLGEYEKKGKHLFLDRKMHRLDLKLDELTCEGEACAKIEESKTLSVYPYRIIAMEKNEDEFTAVSALQKRLRIMQSLQIKSAKLAPKPAPAE